MRDKVTELMREGPKAANTVSDQMVGVVLFTRN